MSEFIVTTCVLHGEKVTSDRVSALNYSRVALADKRNLARQGEEQHGADWHDDGSDCWACCDLMDVVEYAYEIGDEFEGTDGDGHRRVYTVQGFYPDGSPRTSGWNAPHADNCPCNNPEEWY